MQERRHTPKIAIVHDWLNFYGGAERTVRAMHEAFPGAPIYTSVAEKRCLDQFPGADIRTTWLQRMPSFLRKLHKLFPVLRVWAFRSLDLRDYDIVLISSSAESKQVKKVAGQTFICYCHTPIRYYFSHYEEYRADPGFGGLNWLVRLIMPLIVPGMRKKDIAAAKNIDTFIANSETVRERIKKYYKKNALVIHPPVDVDRFTEQALSKDRSGFIMVGRQVPYKRVDLAVKACTTLGEKLSVYGSGSEHENLKAIAGPSVTFYENPSDQDITKALGNAEAFIFPAEEDFGIVQVEALAAGTPVIAYKKGGSLDIVTNGVNGVLFDKQTEASLIDAIKQFKKMKFLPATVHRSSKRFHKSLFIHKIQKIVADHWS